MLKKIVRWLYTRYGEPDIVGMTRVQMYSVNPNIDMEGMNADQLKMYAQKALILQEDEVLNDILNQVCNEQAEFVIGQAQTWEQALCGRFTINGVALVRERIQNAAAAANTKTENFNVHNVV